MPTGAERSFRSCYIPGHLDLGNRPRNYRQTPAHLGGANPAPGGEITVPSHLDLARDNHSDHAACATSSRRPPGSSAPSNRALGSEARQARLRPGLEPLVRLKTGAKAGFPRFPAKARFDSAEFRVGDGLTLRKSKRLGIVGIPGEIKVRWHRDLPPGAKVGAAVVSRSCGKWYVCFQIEVPDVAAPERPFAPVGIDLGLTSLVALSNGETVQTPQHTAKAAKTLRRAQRAVARKKRHSRHQRKAKLRVAQLSARVAAQRRDFSHKLSRSLVDRFTHLAFEDLNIIGLARGMLAKSVHNAAWNTLVQHVQYKAACAGSVVGLVDPRGTSQTCPQCNAVAAKTLAQREHRCDCGRALDRDVAAAQVVVAAGDLRAGNRPSSDKAADCRTPHLRSRLL